MANSENSNSEILTLKAKIEIDPEQYTQVEKLDTCTFSFQEKKYVITLDSPFQIENIDPQKFNSSYTRYLDIHNRIKTKNILRAEQYLEYYAWIFCPLQLTLLKYQKELEIDNSDTSLSNLTEIIEKSLRIRYRYAKLCHQQGKKYGEVEITYEILQQINSN